MSLNEEGLFDGIQIMSPEELEKASGGEEITSEEQGEIKGEEEGFVLKPVAAETGDDETTSENKEIISKSQKSEVNVSQNEAVYKALMKTLVDEGVLTVEEMEELEEMPGTIDSIKQLVNKTVATNFKQAEENWKKSLPADKKRFLEIEDAFDETNLAIIMAQRLEFFDNLTEEDLENNVDLQKQLYFEQLKAKNFSDEDAVEALEDAIAIDKLSEKASKALPDLKKQAYSIVDQSRQQKEAKTKAEREAQNQAFENLIKTIESKESFVDGLNLNKISRDKLKNNIINPVYTDPKTGKEYNSLMYKQMRNPAEFEMIINYYDTLGLFNIDKDGKFRPDISKLKSVAKTAAITELDKVIASEEQRGVGRNTSVETSKKTEGILDLLERATKK